MRLCKGTVKEPHDDIVHTGGAHWYQCPLCSAIEEWNAVERQLEEAKARIVELESGAST
jgi:hypothetical protein